jgi:precorrin-4 methylase
MKILSELINEEIDLYTVEEMKIITEATLILYNRSLILKFIK